MSFNSTNMKRSGAIALWLACWTATCFGAEFAETWEGSPYRIRAVLAIDAPGELAEQLSSELPQYLSRRVNTAIGAIWRFMPELATGSLRHRMLGGLDHFASDETPAEQGEGTAAGKDKRLLLSVKATPWGFELTAREFDHYTERWGPTLRRSTRQRDAVAEQLFMLAEQAIAPLARVRPDSKDPRQLTLDFRGADLSVNGPDFSLARPGDAFKPLRRKTGRDGSLATGGIQEVPWTYIELAAPTGDKSKPNAKLRGMKPLGAGRGRIELLAIAVRTDPGDTQLVLRSRLDKDKPLVGYEVTAQDMAALDGGDKTFRSLGESDHRGDVLVTPGQSVVQMVWVKSAGLPVALLPVVPGEQQRVELRLLDDDMRQRAAARLAALKEDIVDLVARRTIFIARVRQQIEVENLAEARKLLASLDELPGQTQYALALDREAQQLRTTDLQVQRRIDRLFAETRKALGKFLDPQPIGAVHEELRQAEEASKKPAGETEKETG